MCIPSWDKTPSVLSSLSDIHCPQNCPETALFQVTGKLHITKSSGQLEASSSFTPQHTVFTTHPSFPPTHWLSLCFFSWVSSHLSHLQTVAIPELRPSPPRSPGFTIYLVSFHCSGHALLLAPGTLPSIEKWTLQVCFVLESLKQVDYQDYLSEPKLVSWDLKKWRIERQ